MVYLFMLVMTGITTYLWGKSEGITTGSQKKQALANSYYKKGYSDGHDDGAKAAVGEMKRRGYIRPTDINLDSELRKLMLAFHPDRNPKGLDATQVTAHLSALRDKLTK